MAKILEEKGTQYKIAASFGDAFKHVGAWKWLGLLFLIAIPVIMWMLKNDYLEKFPNFWFFILGVAGLAILLGKASSILANNEAVWVEKTEYDKAIANNTVHKLFRNW